MNSKEDIKETEQLVNNILLYLKSMCLINRPKKIDWQNRFNNTRKKQLILQGLQIDTKIITQNEQISI